MRIKWIAAAIFTLSLIFLSTYFSVQLDKYSKNSSIEEAVRKTSLAFAEKSFSTHVELYRTLDSLPMPPACNKQLFENLIYHYKHVKNIGVIKMDYYVCDMYGASKLNQSIKHYDTFQNNQGRVYKYWRNQDYASVASPDGYFVEYDASAYLDFDIKNEIGALFIYGRQSDEIWFSQIRHNLSNTDLNKIKTLLVEKFRALNANPVAKSLFVKQSNLMIGLFIVDEGTIIAVATDTDYVQSYNKTGLLNLAVGLLVGLLMSLTFLHFYIFMPNQNHLKVS